MSSADGLLAMRRSKSTRASAAFAGSSEGNGLSVTAIRKRAMASPSQDFRIDAVGRHLAVEEREDVVDRDIRHLLAYLDNGAAEMRRERDVGQLAQGSIDLRLVLEHIEPGTRDALGLERAQQRRLVDDRPARGVDQERGRLHQAQLTRAD